MPGDPRPPPKMEGPIIMKTSLVVTLLTATTLLTLGTAVAHAAPPCGPGTLGQRFVILERGTSVCDNVSGVVWERTPNTGLRTYQEARVWCANKGSAWQLPGIKDFFTLV